MTAHELAKIHIDKEKYESPNPTTGAALYALGKVAPGLDLYREDGGNKEDERIENGPEMVSLKNGDHFRTAPAKPKQFEIFVNGRKRVVTTSQLSFDEVVALAFNPVPSGPNIMFTISYRNGPQANPEGHLLEGQTVAIKSGMVFNVTPTDKS